MSKVATPRLTQNRLDEIYSAACDIYYHAGMRKLGRMLRELCEELRAEQEDHLLTIEAAERAADEIERLNRVHPS